jgi:superfamily II DNA or RNA helicase
MCIIYRKIFVNIGKRSSREEIVKLLNASVFFQTGLLVLRCADNIERAPVRFQFVQNHWCCEAYHYHALLPWLHEQGIRDTVPRWQRLELELHDSREPNAYQMQALEAWKDAGGRGNIILPISAAKTLVAVRAIHAISSSALVIVPTVQVLSRWFALLENAFQAEIGVYCGGEKRIRPLTVTMSDAARDLIAEHGNGFAMIICDEVQHMPIQTLGEALCMAPAPFRLALTDTSSEGHELSGGRQQINDLFGPTVFTLRLEALTGRQRAAYRTQRILVNLTDEERSSYNAAYAVYMGYVSKRGLQHSHGAEWVQELRRLSTMDPEARRAWLARRQILKLLESCHGKFVALEALLREHNGERMLVFVESREVAYSISRQYLVPAMTDEIEPAERKYILDAFREGRYKVIVTSEGLKVGVDVSKVKAAIVLGDGARTRAYLQRVGRILRKKDPLQTTLIQVLVRDTIDESETAAREEDSDSM